MPHYKIYDEASPRESLAEIVADDAIDALSMFAVVRGYADPRKLEDGIELFNAHGFDGFTRMVFENTELLAVPVVA